MGCYQCGSDEGNQAKLCPDCTKVRLDQLRKMREEDARELKARTDRGNLPSKENSAPTAPNLNAIYAQGAAASIFIGIMAWLLLFSVHGPGWGLSNAEYLYKKCIYRFSGGVSDALAKAKEQTGSQDVVKGLSEELLNGMGTAVCEAIKTACDDPEQEQVCKKALESGF